MITRKLGSTTVETAPIVLGGHGFIDFMGRPKPAIEEAAKVVSYLAEQGLTHFDCTFASERQIYSEILKKTGLRGKLLPVIWHGWHEREEKSADDIVSNFKYILDELGCEKAGMVIFHNTWPEGPAAGNVEQPYPDWVFEGFQRLKSEGLADAVGWGMLSGGRLSEEYLYQIWEQIDFIAPYWNYSLRRQQFMVEFAREHGLGVYAVGAFARGAVFKWPGVKPEELVRPWLKWILREPSVFATSVSLSTMEEAQLTLSACDGKPMSGEEALYFHRMNFPIQMVDYRIHNGQRSLQEFEMMSPEAHGSNMISRNMIKWKE
ncbi:aldo/keto reductase [Paenibacillus albus]|uniref:Aldo/keto reductase n=1 Tax=Paenibacillus albus TaxID=2495582 RepID=A0A3S9A2G1_9BACL|nr:aldo/keto reductase [Paenibacillus albus]AZN39950.1 aldo/keto reductase [Paenibacillus albus]